MTPPTKVATRTRKPARMMNMQSVVELYGEPLRHHCEQIAAILEKAGAGDEITELDLRFDSCLSLTWRKDGHERPVIENVPPEIYIGARASGD